MGNTKIIENQLDVPTTVGTASSINSATCVRLCNTSGSVRVVAISTIVGAATSSFFTIPNNYVEFLQKNPTDVIWADGGIKANKVAFTN